MGFYFSAHPLDKYKDLIEVYKADTIEDIKEDGEERFVKVFGILRDVKKIVTKKSGEIMAVFELEDYFGRISGIIFPRDFSRNMGNFIEGKVVYISGNIQTDYFNGTESRKIVVRDVADIDELSEQRGYKVYILVKDDDRGKIPKLKRIIQFYKGNTPLNLAVKTDTEKKVIKTNSFVSPTKEFIKDVIDLMGRGSIIIK